MAPSDRPKLPATVYQSIESARIKIDEYYWKRLVNLQVSTIAANVPQVGFPDLEPQPPKPQRPDALRSAITRYARNLFVVEAARYPVDGYFEHFLGKLGERTIEHITRTVTSVENAGNTIFRRASLFHHGLSLEQIRETAAQEISGLIDGRLEQVREPSKPTEAEATNRATLGSTEPAAEIERRAKLLADYKAATGNPPNERIYKSANAGIHKPEFYQWRSGRLSAKSKVTKRFEAFLKAKRRPIPRNPTT